MHRPTVLSVEPTNYADNAGIALCCGFQRRFDPSYVAATQAVASGQIGTPIMANMFFANTPFHHESFC
jgi:myo-inositol 2-dehydrogenase/D-chiro-inositol 1-dehydrogenase